MNEHQTERNRPKQHDQDPRDNRASTEDEATRESAKPKDQDQHAHEPAPGETEDSKVFMNHVVQFPVQALVFSKLGKLEN